MLRASGALRVTLLPDVDAFLGPHGAPRLNGKDGDERFWRLLEALDAEVHAGLGAHVTPLLHRGAVRRALIERETRSEDEIRLGRERSRAGSRATCRTSAGDDDGAGLTVAARLSRRDCGRARRIVVQQRRFTQPSSKRFRPLLFMRSEDFPEALALFRLRTAALGSGWDIYEGWVGRYELAQTASEDELDQERRRTRRRRRRRRKRRGGEGDASEEFDAGSEPIDEPLDERGDEPGDA